VKKSEEVRTSCASGTGTGGRAGKVKYREEDQERVRLHEKKKGSGGGEMARKISGRHSKVGREKDLRKLGS